MSLFDNITIEPDEGSAPEPASYFTLIADKQDDARALLVFRLPGIDADARVIWSRIFSSAAQRDAVLGHIDESHVEMSFWGRLVLAMGAPPLDSIVDRIEAVERERLAKAADKRRKQEAAQTRIDCFCIDGKGRYELKLQRGNDDEPAWSISFRGRAERERLRDWLRWQHERFAEFLGYAERHGGAALEKRLIDEMFATERRVKQDGRGAGGARPLRMWRGE